MTSTQATSRAHEAVDLGDDPLSTIVGILRDLSAELEGLTDRVSILEAEVRHSF